MAACTSIRFVPSNIDYANPDIGVHETGDGTRQAYLAPAGAVEFIYVLFGKDANAGGHIAMYAEAAWGGTLQILGAVIPSPNLAVFAAAEWEVLQEAIEGGAGIQEIYAWDGPLPHHLGLRTTADAGARTFWARIMPPNRS